MSETPRVDGAPRGTLGEFAGIFFAVVVFIATWAMSAFLARWLLHASWVVSGLLWPASLVMVVLAARLVRRRRHR